MRSCNTLKRGQLLAQVSKPGEESAIRYPRLKFEPQSHADRTGPLGHLNLLGTWRVQLSLMIYTYMYCTGHPEKVCIFC